MIPLFDLHCDTFLELYKNNFNFKNAPLHISLEKAKLFSPYIQICAIWSDCTLNDDDAFIQYKQVLKYINDQKITLSKDLCDFSSFGLILAIEDARILNNQIHRLDELYSDCVKVITLNWKGTSCIGGAWDTDIGLTAFGLDVVKSCAKKGIIIDLSHSSYQTQDEVLSLSNKMGFSPIFSHSNSYSICTHKRNIKDDMFKRIIEQNGLVGISLCPEHLTVSAVADVNSVLTHIDYYLSLNGEKNICLGCDFDGIASLPSGFASISSLASLYTLVEEKFSKSIANKLFFCNAYEYFQRNLK